MQSDVHSTSLHLGDDRRSHCQKTEKWHAQVLNGLGPRIYRSEGILHVRGQARRIVVQGVQMMFEAVPDRLWNPGEIKRSQLVFIGRDLDEREIRAGFESCLAG